MDGDCNTAKQTRSDISPLDGRVVLGAKGKTEMGLGGSLAAAGRKLTGSRGLCIKVQYQRNSES